MAKPSGKIVNIDQGINEDWIKAGKPDVYPDGKPITPKRRGSDVVIPRQGKATAVTKAATIKNRARRLLRDLTDLLADKTLPERVRRAMEDVPAALRATWADLEDEAGSDEPAAADVAKAGSMEEMAQRIADKIGNDPGFFTACRDMVSGCSWVTDAEGLCAMAHKLVVGKWPTEKQQSVAKSYSRENCMECDKPPTVEFLWAEGMAHAWFCDEHGEQFRQEHKGPDGALVRGASDIDYEKTIDHGIARRRFQDRTSPDSLAKGQPAITFVAASPGHLEAARQEPLVGPSGYVFKTHYLEPLGLAREDTRLLFVVNRLLLDDRGKVREPDEQEIEVCKQSLYTQLDSGSPTVVVALGQVARRALGGRATFVLPHPTAVRLLGDSGEVARKLKQIRKALDAQLLDDSEQSGSRVSKEYMARILKADDEKQEIYGVVLEPDTVDEQDDTITADEIAKAAHSFLVKSRVVGDSHRMLAPVEVIESYTAPADTSIGGQAVKAGSWVIGVHVSDSKLWKSVKQGDYSGFSVGGWANRGSV